MILNKYNAQNTAYFYNVYKLMGGANNCARSKCPERVEFTPSKLWVVAEHRVDYSDLIAERSDLWPGVIGALGFNYRTQPKYVIDLVAVAQILNK